MWIRKCYLDDSSEVPSPIPTRVCSNGEFIPPPQSEKQREFESRLRDLADRNARRLGLSRREFLQTSCGMAAAMLCFNSVFGKTYEVEAVEALEAAAYKERWPKKEFIFDNQTHHVNLSSHWYETDAGRAIGAFLLRWRADALEAIHPSGKPEPVSATTLEAFNKASFVKELFLDSDTVMAVISGVPTANWEDNLLPPDQMARTRDAVTFQQLVKDSLPWIVDLDLKTKAKRELVQAPKGADYHVWAPNGALLTAVGSGIYRYTDDGWAPVASFEKYGVKNITRIAVSPKGNWFAFVAEDKPAP